MFDSFCSFFFGFFAFFEELSVFLVRTNILVILFVVSFVTPAFVSIFNKQNNTPV